MLQSMESASWLEWLYTQPSYIANTGGATGGLPITRPPAFAVPDTEGRRSVHPDLYMADTSATYVCL